MSRYLCNTGWRREEYAGRSGAASRAWMSGWEEDFRSGRSFDTVAGLRLLDLGFGSLGAGVAAGALPARGEDGVRSSDLGAQSSLGAVIVSSGRPPTWLGRCWSNVLCADGSSTVAVSSGTDHEPKAKLKEGIAGFLLMSICV